MGHARVLVGVADDEIRMKLARAVIAGDLSVRALEELAREQRIRDEQGEAGWRIARRGKGEYKRPLIHELERRFAEVLQMKVVIQEGRRKHRGRIVMHYHSLDDFDRVCERLGIETKMEN